MGRGKIDLWGVAAGFVVLVGLFGPWLSKGYDSYGVINPRTGQGELRYHSKIVLSPFFGSILRDDQLASTACFLSWGASFAGVMLTSAVVLGTFRFDRRWINFLISTLSFTGVIFFFLSLGRGLSVGVVTNLEWGLWVTFIGLILMFALSLIRITEV